jgi:hypothetical protein
MAPLFTVFFFLFACEPELRSAFAVYLFAAGVALEFGTTRKRERQAVPVT